MRIVRELIFDALTGATEVARFFVAVRVVAFLALVGLPALWARVVETRAAHRRISAAGHAATSAVLTAHFDVHARAVAARQPLVATPAASSAVFFILGDVDARAAAAHLSHRAPLATFTTVIGIAREVRALVVAIGSHAAGRSGSALCITGATLVDRVERKVLVDLAVAIVVDSVALLGGRQDLTFTEGLAVELDETARLAAPDAVGFLGTLVAAERRIAADLDLVWNAEAAVADLSGFAIRVVGAAEIWIVGPVRDASGHEQGHDHHRSHRHSPLSVSPA